MQCFQWHWVTSKKQFLYYWLFTTAQSMHCYQLTKSNIHSMKPCANTSTGRVCAVSDSAIKGFCADLPEAYSRRNQLRNETLGAAVIQSHLIRIWFAFNPRTWRLMVLRLNAAIYRLVPSRCAVNPARIRSQDTVIIETGSVFARCESVISQQPFRPNVWRR